MAQYTQVLGAPKNRLLIDGVDVDLFNKRAIIDSYSKGSWDSVDITSAKTSIRDSMVLYHGELHFIGSSNADPTVGMHCKFDGTNWTSNVSTLPYNPSYCKAIVLNDEIHIFGGGCTSLTPKKDLKQMKYHYKWDDVSNTWTKVSTLPYYFFNGSAVIINGQVHLLGGGRTNTTKKKHYYFNGKSWKSDKGLPFGLSGLYKAINYDLGYANYLIVFGTSTYKDSLKQTHTFSNHRIYDIKRKMWIGSNTVLGDPDEMVYLVFGRGREIWWYSYYLNKTLDQLYFSNAISINPYAISGKKKYDDYIGMQDYLTSMHMTFFNGKLYLIGGESNKVMKSLTPVYSLTVEDK